MEIWEAKMGNDWAKWVMAGMFLFVKENMSSYLDPSAQTLPIPRRPPRREVPV